MGSLPKLVAEEQRSEEHLDLAIVAHHCAEPRCPPLVARRHPRPHLRLSARRSGVDGAAPFSEAGESEQK